MDDKVKKIIEEKNSLVTSYKVEEQRVFLKHCLESDYKDLLYEISKIVAETDSIGEQYGEGPKDYTKDRFEEEIKEILGETSLDANYLWSAGLDIFGKVLQFQKR